MKTKYFFVSLAVFAFALFAFEANAGIFQFSETDPNYLQALSIAAAQEGQEEVDIEKKLELDEDLKPEDFGLTDVGILPTNPFYFVKSIRRGMGSLFTRDPAAKAELKLQYAAEKLLEAKEVAKNEDFDDGDKGDAIENFKDELKEVKHRVEVASESLNDEQSKELSKKVLAATLKYGKSLGKIEKDVSPGLFLNVKEAKDAASEALASTFGLTEPGVVSNQLTEVFDEQKGSEFKDFKNLEVLKEVEAKVPESAKDAIKNAQENALNRLQAELEKFESAKKSIFEDFVKESGGSEIRHLEIINELEARPISKDLRNVIAGAKESIFSKAETRLNGLSQENKEKFAEHLGEGNIEDFRTLRELQNNIDLGVISGISNVASRAETEFVKKIGSTEQNDVQKKEFLDSIERFHDAKSISVLNEIEKLIPEDKRAFFGELKSKAVQEIKNDIGRATNSSQRQSVYDSLAGDHPEDFAELDKFKGTVQTPFDIGVFIEGIKRAQYEAIQDKIENISNKDRLAKYEEEFKKLGQEIPDYFTFRRVFEQQKNIFESPEKALKKIEEAEKALAEFRGVKSSLPIDLAYKGGEFDSVLRDIESVFAHAERRLEMARTVLSYDDIGRAFGEAQSAENMARDGIALVAKYKSGVKETKCPFYYPPPSSFCSGGILVHQNDQNGCQLPPRCELRESKECLMVDPQACPAGAHRETFKDDKGCFTYGKCVEDKATCTAYFEGYVFDKNTSICRKESSSGCSDPFVYHTSEECTKAKNQVSVCPSLPTVDSCPASERKVITFSSSECGIYYTCQKETTTTTDKNWVEHFWKFKDGLTEKSMVLNRTDNEYLNFISGVEKQCLEITKDKFNWKSGAGNDSSENWQNFGIPDCSGAITTTTTTTSSTCSQSLLSLLGTGCHSMFTDSSGKQIYCNTEMTKSAKEGDTATTEGCQSGGTTTTTTSTCTPASACTTTATCTASGFYWYNGTCRESQPVSGTCAYAADYCVNESECLNNKYYWCRDDCYGSSTACPTTTNTCSGLGSDWTIYGSYCLDSARTRYAPLGSAITSSIKSCTAADLPVTGCASAPNTTTTTTTNTTATGTCSTASSCTTQSNCMASNFFWYDGTCHNSSQTTTTTTTTTTSNCSQSLTTLLGTGCHPMSMDSSGRQVYCDGAMTKSAKEGDTVATQGGCQPGTVTATACNNNGVCDSGETVDSCSGDCGSTGGGFTSNCSQSLTNLLGIGCHPMYQDSSGRQVYCDGNMTKSAKEGDTATTEGCQSSTTTGGGSTSNCSTPANCFDQSICTSSGWYWYNSGCWSSAQTTTNTTTTCSSDQYWNGTACVANTTTTTATTCTSGQYWNGTACVANTGCSSPSNCFDQSICTSSGWYWYNSACWGSPQTTTGGGANALQGFWNKLLGY